VACDKRSSVVFCYKIHTEPLDRSGSVNKKRLMLCSREMILIMWCGVDRMVFLHWPTLFFALFIDNL